MTLEELKQLDEINEDNTFIRDELIEFIAKNNRKGFNLEKLLEETCELNEVIAKMLFKTSDEHKPKREKLWEELHDVTLRIELYVNSLDGVELDEFEDFMKNRHLEKMNKFLSYLKEDKYTNTI